MNDKLKTKLHEYSEYSTQGTDELEVIPPENNGSIRALKLPSKERFSFLVNYQGE